MIKSVDLTNYGYSFEENELNDLRKINFIYGKNGSGKSSLVKALKSQYAEDHDVLVYNGPEGLIKDREELDAIVLGESNVKIDDKITEIESEILEIELELKNTVSKCEETSRKYK